MQETRKARTHKINWLNHVHHYDVAASTYRIWSIFLSLCTLSLSQHRSYASFVSQQRKPAWSSLFLVAFQTHFLCRVKKHPRPNKTRRLLGNTSPKQQRTVCRPTWLTIWNIRRKCEGLPVACLHMRTLPGSPWSICLTTLQASWVTASICWSSHCGLHNETIILAQHHMIHGACWKPLSADWPLFPPFPATPDLFCSFSVFCPRSTEIEALCFVESRFLMTPT